MADRQIIKINRTLGKEFGEKPKVTITGSFISVRVEDQGGNVTLCTFSAITARAAELIRENTYLKLQGRSNTSYHMGGCVTTWSTNDA